VVPAHVAASRSGVECRVLVVELLLRQEELAFIKALSTFQLSPAILKEPQHYACRWGQSPPTLIESARGQTQSQRAN
jgi:hypothetical protein